MFALPPNAIVNSRKIVSSGFRNQARSLRRSSTVAIFAAALVLVILSSASAYAQAIPNTYFGMHMHAGVISRQPWPVDSFGSVRLWDAGVSWTDINGTKGVYNWTNLDLWLADAQTHGDQLLYTFGHVPQWASSDPYNTACGGQPGSCAPPTDVNPDGSGTDQIFKNFVTALATHNKNSSTAHIQFWELWNEPYHTAGWSGTFAQLVRMASDATAILKSVDPSAVVMAPSVCIEGSKSRNWLASYLAAGGSNYADAVAFHGYVQKKGTPLVAENIVSYISLTRTMLAQFGLQNRPLWDTEASWGDPTTSSPVFSDPDMHMAFVARMYVLQQSAGVARFFWYQWNNTSLGTMWVPTPGNPSGPGTLLKPGIAYAQVQNWLVGATLVSACSANGSVWSCNYSRPNGYQARIVWDTSQSCANGTCTTSNYSVPSSFIQYRTLDGNKVNITGSHVSIGAKPIILEN